MEFEVERPARTNRVDDPLIRWLSTLMDTQFEIPGTRIRFGLDPIIGLIPGLGDTASAAVSAFLIVQSSRHGVPKVVLVRMCANVFLNWLVGCVPGVGDVLSVWFKSNARNYELFQKHAGHARRSTAGDWLFVGLLVLGIAALLVGSWWLLLTGVRAIAHAARG